MNKNNMLITGSSRVIGSSVARIAKKRGYEVILHGRSESSELLDLASELNSQYIVFDVANEAQVQEALLSVKLIHCVVNSAGVNVSKPFNCLTAEDWKTVYDVNVFGLANVIKYTLPIIRKTTTLGRVVNIASVKGSYSAVGRVAYASSKAAVINLTAGLAKELAPNVLVNAVAPGFVNTDMTASTWSSRIKKQTENILLGRVATPLEIAEVVLFLADERCTYMTGQTIFVDGGFSIKND